jgi:hypothetical protein
MKSLILVFHTLANICLYSVKFKNILFFSIRIQFVQQITNGYSVSIKYLVNSVLVLNTDKKVNKIYRSYPMVTCKKEIILVGFLL